MLRPRIIPCLLVHEGGLAKTRRFADPKYVGDPINAVRTFNEKEVDELIVVDIDATRHGKEPSYDLIAKLAAECRMPLCYGGGVRSVEQVEKIVGLGVEKVAVSAAATSNPELVAMAAARVGTQSVVVVIDALKTRPGQYEVVTHNGSRRTGLAPAAFARDIEDRGAGEIVINAVERDGEMTGYDLELVAQVREAITLPLTVLGGAGSHADIEKLIAQHGIVGAAAGSLFVFKGKYRAVLINYPNRTEKDGILARAGGLA